MSLPQCKQPFLARIFYRFGRFGDLPAIDDMSGRIVMGQPRERIVQQVHLGCADCEMDDAIVLARTSAFTSCTVQELSCPVENIYGVLGRQIENIESPSFGDYTGG